MYKLNTKLSSALLALLLLNCAPMLSAMTLASSTKLASISLSALGSTIYKTVHEDGTVTYSDQPSPGAIEITLNAPTNTIPSNQQASATQAPTKRVTNKEYSLRVLQPEAEATIRNNVGEIKIAAALKPRIGGVFQLTINGQIHESATGMFTLNNMDRGAYEYTIKFIDNSGKVIASTPSRNMYLHKASALIN